MDGRMAILDPVSLVARNICKTELVTGVMCSILQMFYQTTKNRAEKKERKKNEPKKYEQ